MVTNNTISQVAFGGEPPDWDCYLFVSGGFCILLKRRAAARRLLLVDGAVAGQKAGRIHPEQQCNGSRRPLCERPPGSG